MTSTLKCSYRPHASSGYVTDSVTRNSCSASLTSHLLDGKEVTLRQDPSSFKKWFLEEEPLANPSSKRFHANKNFGILQDIDGGLACKDCSLYIDGRPWSYTSRHTLLVGKTHVLTAKKVHSYGLRPRHRAVTTRTRNVSSFRPIDPCLFFTTVDHELRTKSQLKLYEGEGVWKIIVPNLEHASRTLANNFIIDKDPTFFDQVKSRLAPLGKTIQVATQKNKHGEVTTLTVQEIT